jgi:acyl-CoA thioester hydrolase
MPSQPSDPLEPFPVVVTVPVQWGDHDSFGHVNNTVYFRWFESARIAYCLRIGLGDRATAEGVAPILASITCHFRRALTFPDTVRVGARITRIGRTSMTMEHTIVSEALAGIAADATSVLVVLDYRENKPHPVPAEIREAIEQLEGKSFT